MRAEVTATGTLPDLREAEACGSGHNDLIQTSALARKCRRFVPILGMNRSPSKEAPTLARTPSSAGLEAPGIPGAVSGGCCDVLRSAASGGGGFSFARLR
jgi:hypothetical protein